MNRACTNDGCNCTPNSSIECHATTCAHHCKDVNQCGLNSIRIGNHDTNDYSTDCKNFTGC